MARDAPQFTGMVMSRACRRFTSMSNGAVSGAQPAVIKEVVRLSREWREHFRRKTRCLASTASRVRQAAKSTCVWEDATESQQNLQTTRRRSRE